MSDLISREEAIALIREQGIKGNGYDDREREEDVVDMLESLPTVEAKEVVHGKWEDDQYVWKCNRCNRWLEVTDGNGEMNFCPNCGADMRKKV